MPRFLILRLDGPMQAWGGHTYEDFRPSHLFPTRSGLLGLIGACMGLDRGDYAGLNALGESLELTVRAERLVFCGIRDDILEKSAVKLPDFHTVQDARKVDGKPNKNPVVSRREYLFDAVFSVAVGAREGGSVTLDTVAYAVRHPVFTPSLGRRSCPLARPLFEVWVDDAENAKQALSHIDGCGIVYGEGAALVNQRPLPVRDVPMYGDRRQFSTRQMYVHASREE